jgi:Tol biopolymer transport system component
MKIKYLLLILLSSLFAVAANANEEVEGGILDGKVNNDYEDYGAFVIYGDVQDTLFFTSSRKVKKAKKTALNAEMFFSTRPARYRLERKPINEGWSAAQQIKAEASRINEFTRGSQALSADRIIFAAERDLSTANASGTSYLLDIWQMTKRIDGFSLPEPITVINDPDAWDSQPAISPDGKILYFVSNRDGGKGGLDIWYTVMNNQGSWTPPKLVPNINTEGNEVSPHYGADGKFYFSSDWDTEKGEKSETRKDIYRADFKEVMGIPQPFDPIPLDEAMRQDAEEYGITIPSDIRYNSDADDEFPFISPDRKAIFLTSNRSADYEKRNIYAFTLPKSKIRLLVNVKERIYDAAGNLVLAPTTKTGLPLNLVDTETDVSQEILSGEVYEVEVDKNYKIKFSRFVEEECYQNKIEGPDELDVLTERPFGLDTMYVRDVLITRRKIEIPPIVFHSTDTLPYFITGYWYPNTTENLGQFRTREASGFFDETGFVDSTGFDYAANAWRIDREFEEKIYKPLDELLPNFQEFCRDTLYLKVTIHGWTDPRGLSAGEEHPYRPASKGKRNYPDEAVTIGVDERGQPVDIQTGMDMWRYNWPKSEDERNKLWIKLPNEGENGNVLLSKLRAYYTFRTFDNAMKERSDIYEHIRDNGRILVDAEGFGIDKEGYKERNLRDDPQSRRIEIYIDVLRPEELAGHKRLAGGELLNPRVAETVAISTDLGGNVETETEETITHQVIEPDVEVPMEEEIEPDFVDEEPETEETITVGENMKTFEGVEVVDPGKPAEMSLENNKNTKTTDEPSKKPIKRAKKVKTNCYQIQYKNYDTKAEADAAKQKLIDGGIKDALVQVYISPFGDESYRLRSGCYDTPQQAIGELNNLKWTMEALELTKKPDIVR